MRARRVSYHATQVPTEATTQVPTEATFEEASTSDHAPLAQIALLVRLSESTGSTRGMVVITDRRTREAIRRYAQVLTRALIA